MKRKGLVRSMLARTWRWRSGAILLVALAAGGCGSGRSIFGPSPGPSPGPVAGFVYATNFEGKISEFTSTAGTGTLNLFGTVSGGAAGGPLGVAAAPTGSFLYVANAGDNKLHAYSITPNTGVLGSIGTISTGTNSGPNGVAIDSSGTLLFVANQTAGTITDYSINSVTGALTPIAGASGLLAPQGMAITPGSPGGEFVIVAENGRGTVDAFSIDTTGALTLASSVPSLGTVAGTPSQVVTDPVGLNAYVTDFGTAVVSQFSIGSGGALAPVATFSTGASNSQPVGIAINPGGTFVYVANSFANTIAQFQVSSLNGNLVANGPTATSGLATPTGMAIDSTGSFLYVTNRGNGSVAQFNINAINGVLSFANVVNTESPPNSASSPRFIVFVP